MTPAQRLSSLDAFRGFAIAGMVLVNNPGDWNALYPQLAHAAWHGCTFTDWIFPFFLFAVGVSMTISLDARARAGAAPGTVLAAMARRAAVIFLVGLALNAVPHFEWERLRIPGVLQRIALCSLLAAPIALHCRWRGVAGWIAALFALYSVPMLLLPVPDAAGVVGAGVLEPGRDFGAWVDRQVFGSHVWRAARTWDPEGLVSTLPAVGTVLIGVLAGRGLAAARPPAETTVWLLLAGLALVLAGWVADAWLMPINKNLWTPSYTLFTGGWALCVFAAFFWLMDGTAWPRLRQAAARVFRPLVIYGLNALFLFVLSGLLARLLLAFKTADGRSYKQWLYAPLQALPLAPRDASLAWALAFQLLMFGVAWWMWKRRWFIKA
jgi:predicted acyltransferase